MRHWLLVTMIALLPLRGWVADAMAVDMQNLPAHAVMAMEDQGAGHGLGACDEHVTANAEGGSAEHQHNACDVCHVPAMVQTLPLQHTPHTVHSPLTGPSEPFASSEAQPGIKPPIS